MDWSKEAGLPLWLFIIVVLLPLPTIILPMLVIWRRCLQRRGEQGSSPSKKSTYLDDKWFYWKERSLRPFRKKRLPESTVQFTATQDERCLPRKWPETTYSNQSPGVEQEAGHPNLWEKGAMYREHVKNLQRGSWSSLLRRMDFRGHRRSLSGTTVESARPSYVSGSTDVATLDGKKHSPPRKSGHDMRWLDTPSAQISPLTPLDLPWSPMSNIESIRLGGEGNKPPTLPMHVPRRRERVRRLTSTQRRETKKLESWLAASHCVLSPTSSARHSSAAMNEAFLQAWTKVYYQYLGLGIGAETPPMSPPRAELPASTNFTVCPTPVQPLAPAPATNRGIHTTSAFHQNQTASPIATFTSFSQPRREIPATSLPGWQPLRSPACSSYRDQAGRSWLVMDDRSP